MSHYLPLKDYQDGYEAGKAEGRRLERRAMERWLSNHLNVSFPTACRLVQGWLASRSKPAKRKSTP